MTDALCGPSNPLQTLKTYSQVDRTLQQDRFPGAKQSPAQGFRTPDPRAGSLDADFAAFEAGRQQPFHLQQQHLVPFQSFGSAHSLHQSRQQDAQSTPGWAADFQKLHLGPTPNQPIPQHRFPSEAPMVRSNTGSGAADWHSEFMRQQQQHPAGTVRGKAALRSPGTELGYLHGQSVLPLLFTQEQPGVYQGTHHTLKEKAYQDVHVDVAEDAAFEAAFAQAEGARTSEQSETQPYLSRGEVAGVRMDPIFQTHGHNTSQLNAPQAPGNGIFQNPGEPAAIRIGSDAIPYSDRGAPRTSEQSSHDADELARTAGQLLNSISHETSPKFEQSQFLALMRRIRDREVEVKGEEFCETDKGANMSRYSVSAESVPVSRIAPEVDVQMGTQDSQAAQQGSVMDLTTEHLGATRVQVPPIREDTQALHPGGKGYPVLEGDLGDVGTRADADDRHKYDHWASGGLGGG